MIRYLKRSEIDDDKWNECIKQSASPQIFGCTFYLDVCCPEWSALVLNDYDAVFPVILKTKFSIRYLSQPYFVRHFGVYSKSKNIDYPLWINELQKLSTYFNFDIFNIDQAFEIHFKVSEKKYQTTDLNREYELIKKNYSDSHKRKIKKFSALESTIKNISDYSVFIQEFKNTIELKNLNYKTSHLNTLLDLMNTLPKHYEVFSNGVYVNNELMAAAYFVRYENRLLYLKGFKKYSKEVEGAMFYLFDQVIKENCNQDCILDYGGSNDNNVRQFFSGFSAKDSVYLHLEKNNLPKIIRWLKK
jgi:hypothetical protein